MNITPALKERFCKDVQIPIKIFSEPYFTERLELYDKHFNCLEKYNRFVKMLEQFNDEQEYFAAYNQLKETAIQHLQSNSTFEFFSQNEDMTKFNIENRNFPKSSIYKQTFIGEHFISFDICKGNFTALKHYSPDIFNGKESYEDFIGQFTNNEHFIESKYIRQVIFGTLNPKRQVKYEEYLMDKVLTHVLTVFDKEQIVFFSTDEIVVKLNKNIEFGDETQLFIEKTVNQFCNLGITIRAEVFYLDYMQDEDTYIKKVYFISKESNGETLKPCDVSVIKNATNLTMPFVLRKLYNLPPSDNDNVFIHEGRLAKFI